MFAYFNSEDSNDLQHNYQNLHNSSNSDNSNQNGEIVIRNPRFSESDVKNCFDKPTLINYISILNKKKSLVQLEIDKLESKIDLDPHESRSLLNKYGFLKIISIMHTTINNQLSIIKSSNKKHKKIDDMLKKILKEKVGEDFYENALEQAKNHVEKLGV